MMNLDSFKNLQSVRARHAVIGLKTVIINASPLSLLSAFVGLVAVMVVLSFAHAPVTCCWIRAGHRACTCVLLTPRVSSTPKIWYRLSALKHCNNKYLQQINSCFLFFFKSNNLVGRSSLNVLLWLWKS